MNSIPKRKKVELLLLPLFIGILYFLTSDRDGAVLFSFGYIWNWVCSLGLDEIYREKRYKYSLVRLVLNIQSNFLKPFKFFPPFAKSLIGILPAGAFWFLIIFMYDSQIPIWAPFLGSFVLELTSLELLFVSKEKGRP